MNTHGGKSQLSQGTESCTATLMTIQEPTNYD